MSSSSFVVYMDVFLDNDCCFVCYDFFILFCQVNCVYWFCGEFFILEVLILRIKVFEIGNLL